MKIVIVLDESLAPGLSANAAAALAFSVSPLLEGCVGGQVVDRSGSPHPGITNVPLPVLASSASELDRLRSAAQGLRELSCIDFSDIARRAKNYADYALAMAAAPSGEIRYLGLCIYGEDAAVRSLTGSLPLFGR